MNHRPNRSKWDKGWSNRPNWGNAWQIGDNHYMNSFVNNVNNNFTHMENNYHVFNPGGWNNFAHNWNNYNYWGSWHHSHPAYSDWYHGSWHGNYGSGWGYGVGLATGALVSSWAMGPTVYNTGYYNYSNPYYTEPLVIQIAGGHQTVIHYDQPLQVAPPQVSADGSLPEEIPRTIAEGSAVLLDQARRAFGANHYQQALNLTNEMIAGSPNDPVVHQFRALILFATEEYRQASATLYSILSIGPPWDWTTMSGLYDNTETYALQFRMLEDYSADNPKAAFARFLLGYHYMVCGYNDAAIAEFKAAFQLEPTDQLAVSLVNMLGGTMDGQDPVAADDILDPPEIVEVDPEQLFGNWISSRSKGPKISLVLGENGNFTWTVNQGSAPSVMQGEFSLGGDKLVLQPDQGPPMMGTVSDVAEGQFNFRIVGASPGDQGLQFVR